VLAEEQEPLPLLKYWNLVTTFFSFKENSSLSSVLPVIIGLIDGLIRETRESEDESFPAAVKEFKIVVAKELTKRWGIENLDTS